MKYKKLPTLALVSMILYGRRKVDAATLISRINAVNGIIRKAGSAGNVELVFNQDAERLAARCVLEELGIELEGSL
jgi:uncharacterized protein (DUF2336 family)